DVMIGTHSQAVGVGVLAGIYALVVLIPGIAVSVRRLHDTDRSGWWLLIVFIPIIGPIVLIVFMCIDGTPGANRFGPSPKEAPVVAPAPGELRVAARATGRGTREAGSAGNCESTQRGRHELSKLRRPNG